jgi:sarcosine oxidase gamma subunit
VSPESPIEPVEAAHRPVLRVVKGDLTPEELAALVAVVAARNAAAFAAAARTKPRLRSEWGHPARQVRTAHTFGPDQWRRSSFGR